MAAASSGLRASPGTAAPVVTSGERPGRRREQTTRTRPADTVPEPAAPATAITPRSPERQRTVSGSAPGWPGWLDTGILSRACRETRRNIPLKPAPSASCRKTTGQKSEWLPRPPTTLRGSGGGSDAVRRQVIQIAWARGQLDASAWRGAASRARTRDSGTAQASVLTRRTTAKATSATVTSLSVRTRARPPDPKALSGPGTGRTRDGAALVVRIIRF